MHVRRSLLLLPLLLGSCTAKVPDGPSPGLFAGSGLERLCIAGDPAALRAGIVTYAADKRANCTVAGALHAEGSELTLKPQGEGSCRIGLALEGDIARVTRAHASCAYYCGPGATLAGKAFKRAAGASPAADLAGEALC